MKGGRWWTPCGGMFGGTRRKGKNERGSQVLRLRVRRIIAGTRKSRRERKLPASAMFRGMPCHDRMGRGTMDTTQGLRWAQVVV